MRSKTFAVFVIGLLTLNYYHFFIKDNRVKPVIATVPLSLNEIDYSAYPGRSNIYPAQAINVLLVGNKPDELMTELGWKRNKTFSRDSISFSDYLDLLQQDMPPISDLYWNGQSQWQAWQLEGTLTSRSHIRWWHAGQSKQSGQDIWVGALSYDDGLKLSHYRGLLTMLHDTDPQVDKERNQLQHSIEISQDDWKTKKVIPEKENIMPERREYVTDGSVLLIEEI